MNALVESGYIIKGDPDHSPFFQKLSFDGPMFKVFTEHEIDVWKKWTFSLGQIAPPPTPADAMVRLISELNERQKGTPGHLQVNLKGPDPDKPDSIIEKPITWWFNQSPESFMEALKLPANGWIVPGDPTSSKFFSLLNDTGRMGQAFHQVAPGSKGLTYSGVIQQWIKDGSSPINKKVSAVSAVSSKHAVRKANLANFHQLGQTKLFGMGCLH